MRGSSSRRNHRREPDQNGVGSEGHRDCLFVFKQQLTYGPWPLRIINFSGKQHPPRRRRHSTDMSQPTGQRRQPSHREQQQTDSTGPLFADGLPFGRQANAQSMEWRSHRSSFVNHYNELNVALFHIWASWYSSRTSCRDFPYGQKTSAQDHLLGPPPPPLPPSPQRGHVLWARITE